VVTVDPLANGRDVRLFEFVGNVHGILCAPPCTMFAVSGAGHRAREKREGTYTPKILDALSIVDACLRLVLMCKPDWWALENPVGTLRRWIGPPKLYFDPCDFGDPYTKKTCLWGQFNLPRKRPVKPLRVCPQGSWLQQLGGTSAKTKRLRSMTPAGFARAFFTANP
jgi:hypothetical protein